MVHDAVDHRGRLVQFMGESWRMRVALMGGGVTRPARILVTGRLTNP